MKDNYDFSKGIKNPYKTWLESLKAAPDDKAIRLLIERLDVKNKTDFRITSTLKSAVGNIGRGDTIHSFPKILFMYHSSMHS